MIFFLFLFFFPLNLNLLSLTSQHLMDREVNSMQKNTKHCLPLTLFTLPILWPLRKPSTPNCVSVFGQTGTRTLAAQFWTSRALREPWYTISPDHGRPLHLLIPFHYCFETCLKGWALIVDSDTIIIPKTPIPYITGTTFNMLNWLSQFLFSTPCERVRIRNMPKPCS